MPLTSGQIHVLKNLFETEDFALWWAQSGYLLHGQGVVAKKNIIAAMLKKLNLVLKKNGGKYGQLTAHSVWLEVEAHLRQLLSNEIIPGDFLPILVAHFINNKLSARARFSYEDVINLFEQYMGAQFGKELLKKFNTDDKQQLLTNLIQKTVAKKTRIINLELIPYLCVAVLFGVGFWLRKSFDPLANIVPDNAVELFLLCSWGLVVYKLLYDKNFLRAFVNAESTKTNLQQEFHVATFTDFLTLELVEKQTLSAKHADREAGPAFATTESHSGLKFAEVVKAGATSSELDNYCVVPKFRRPKPPVVVAPPVATPGKVVNSHSKILSSLQLADGRRAYHLTGEHVPPNVYAIVDEDALEKAKAPSDLVADLRRRLKENSVVSTNTRAGIKFFVLRGRGKEKVPGSIVYEFKPGVGDGSRIFGGVTEIEGLQVVTFCNYQKKHSS